MPDPDRGATALSNIAPRSGGAGAEIGAGLLLTDSGPDRDLCARLKGPFEALPEGAILVAVSGGGDSVALLSLLRAWGERPLYAATVDHRLRPDSGQEAQFVADLCADWSIPHAIVPWDAAPEGNLQAAARAARQRLLAAHAQTVGAASVVLGHTVEDQAETFLLRLARGSGVDGLSAMAPQRPAHGLIWARPLLTARRAELRDHLRTIGQTWVEDPSNVDPQFDRVRLRQAAPALAELGLGPERLAATADLMGLAREALGQTAHDLARTSATPHVLGHLTLARAPLAEAPLEVGLRVLAGALTWVTGTAYRPRLSTLKPALADLTTAPRGAATLHGALIRWDGDSATVLREPARLAPPIAPPGPWDGRFRARATHPDLRLGALGTAPLDTLPWRETGLSRETLSVSPALWQGARLVAHPLLAPDPDHEISHVCGIEAFFESFMSR